MRKKQIAEIHQRKAVSTTHKRTARIYRSETIIAAVASEPDEVKLQQAGASLSDEEEPLTEHDLAEINTILMQAQEVMSRTAERLDRIHNTAVEIVAELRAARGLRTTAPGAIAEATGEEHVRL